MKDETKGQRSESIILVLACVFCIAQFEWTLVLITDTKDNATAPQYYIIKEQKQRQLLQLFIKQTSYKVVLLCVSITETICLTTLHWHYDEGYCVHIFTYQVFTTDEIVLHLWNTVIRFLYCVKIDTGF